MLIIDVLQRKVTFKDEEIAVSKLMYDVLVYLASNNNSVKTREELISNCWDVNFVTQRTVDVIVRKIRKRFGYDTIKTIAGVGYGIYGDVVQMVGHNGQYKMSKSNGSVVELNNLYSDDDSFLIPVNFATFGDNELVITTPISANAASQKSVAFTVDDFLSKYHKVNLAVQPEPEPEPVS